MVGDRRARLRRRALCLDLVFLEAGQVAESEAPRHCVPELAHVAGPGAIRPTLQQLVRQGVGCTAEQRAEVTGQERDVAFALAQRRQRDARDRDAVEQVVAEASLLDLAVEVAARGCHQPDIDANRALPAHATDFGALDGAQQLGLELQRQVADLVDEERAAVGTFEHALAGCDRARERAAFVSEQLRFDQVRCDGGAVEHHERRASPGAFLVQCLGKLLLARTGLALDHQWHVDLCQPLA